MNVLYGPCFKVPHPTAASMWEVLKGTNADVLFLQEAGQQSFPDLPQFNSGFFGGLSKAEAQQRVGELQALLVANGYSVVQVNGLFNPALVATRLPIMAVGESFGIDGPADPAEETRGARRVVVSLGAGVGALALVATHLHHTVRGGKKGVRRAEVQAILRGVGEEEAFEGSLSPLPQPLLATVIASDFNGSRKKDYSEREWAVLLRSLERAGEPSADGVAELLEGEGYTCTYDASAGAPAFTHWSGQTVDFCWFKPTASGSKCLMPGVARPIYTALSDHLPVVHDFSVLHCGPPPPSPSK
jgi:hypothetical protein